MMHCFELCTEAVPFQGAARATAAAALMFGAHDCGTGNTMLFPCKVRFKPDTSVLRPRDARVTFEKTNGWNVGSTSLM